MVLSCLSSLTFRDLVVEDDNLRPDNVHLPFRARKCEARRIRAISDHSPYEYRETLDSSERSVLNL